MTDSLPQVAPQPAAAVAAGAHESRARVAARWFLAAAVAAPVGVVLHEAVHFVTAVLVGFEDPVLHFASTGYAGNGAFWDAYLAGAELPLSRTSVGLVAAAGVVFTWALSVAATVAARRVGVRSFLGAILGATALLAPARAYTGLSYMLFVRPSMPGAFPNFDEFRAAQALGTPVDPWVLAGLVVMAGAWVALAPKIGRDGWLAYPLLLVGTVAGMAAWLVVGPFLLP